MNTKRTGLALAGAGVVLLLTGCGSAPAAGGHVTAHTSDQPTASGNGSGNSSGSSTSGATGGADTSSSGGTSGGASGSSSGGSSGGSSGSSSGGGASAGPAQCMTAQLDASVEQGDSAAGSSYYTLVLRNTGAQPCQTGGYGGVSLVGHGNGTQIGAAAKRTEEQKAHSLVLQPGQKADATLQVSSVDNYASDQCHPTPADGLRIYPPNNTQALFVKVSDLAGCTNTKLQLLSLAPYRSAR